MNTGGGPKAWLARSGSKISLGPTAQKLFSLFSPIFGPLGQQKKKRIDSQFDVRDTISGTFGMVWPPGNEEVFVQWGKKPNGKYHFGKCPRGKCLTKIAPRVLSRMAPGWALGCGYDSVSFCQVQEKGKHSLGRYLFYRRHVPLLSNPRPITISLWPNDIFQPFRASVALDPPQVFTN